MRAIEQVSRWERLTHPLLRVLDRAFGCDHRNLSRVFTIESRTYKVCCDCGTKFDYSLNEMSISDSRTTPGALEQLRARQI
jgi:hypothetical protein